MTGQSQIIFHLRYDVNVIYLFPEVGFDVVFLLFNAKRKIDCNSILATDYHNVYPTKNFRCECCCDSCCCLFFLEVMYDHKKFWKHKPSPVLADLGLTALVFPLWEALMDENMVTLNTIIYMAEQSKHMTSYFIRCFQSVISLRMLLNSCLFRVFDIEVLHLTNWLDWWDTCNLV